MKDQFWPFAECWDGWRGVRIGSPVVVSSGWGPSQALEALGECLRRDDVGPLRSAKFRAGYMMERFSETGIFRSSMRTPRGCSAGTAPAVEAMGTE
ncbi:hypothetical protein GCM10010276_61450 [Streptomyces longisporus]|uniref:Uncharacterized protein n=1 Tax=Streptomyces longisporus TaxID=1948 RepID=A0ABP6A3J9_STRLO